MQKAKLLIMGGAGYIGSHIVRLLNESQDFEPIVYDNLVTGHKETIPSNVTFVEGDAKNEQLLCETMKRHHISGVIHLCAYSLVGESVLNPLKYFDNNVVGAISLLKAMQACDVRNLVFSSTAACYGEPTRIPIKEEDATVPINPYGQSKLMIEQMIRTLPLNSICFRYFNVAGAGMGVGEMHSPETHLIPNIVKAALSGNPVKLFGTDYPTADGTCVRDYIHVVDLAEAHVLGMRHLLKNGQQITKLILNLGSKLGCSVREIIGAVQKVAPLGVKEEPRREGDPATLVADPTKAFEVLGWKTTRGVDEMVQSAYKFHKDVEPEYQHKK